MNEERKKIQDFTDIQAWQAAHRLVLLVYKATGAFPKEEQFGLVSQLRRAAVSVSSNIAEGFGRYSYKERVQFFYLAQGSLIEVKNQLLVGRDVGFLPAAQYAQLKEEADTAHRLLQGLIKKSKQILSLTS